LANSDLPKRTQFFKKVCLTAFAESEFGNPFYQGRSQLMGWQIPICQKERRPLKKVCLTAFAESEFGNPFYQGRSPIMGWQIPICQKERSSLKKYA